MYFNKPSNIAHPITMGTPCFLFYIAILLISFISTPLFAKSGADEFLENLYSPFGISVGFYCELYENDESTENPILGELRIIADKAKKAVEHVELKYVRFRYRNDKDAMGTMIRYHSIENGGIKHFILNRDGSFSFILAGVDGRDLMFTGIPKREFTTWGETHNVHALAMWHSTLGNVKVEWKSIQCIQLKNKKLVFGLF